MAISVTQAADKLGLTRAGIIKAINRGDIKAILDGKYYRVEDAELSKFAANRPRRGRPDQIPAENKERILAVAQTPPQSLGLERWTLELLRQKLRDEGVAVSQSYLADLLIEAGIRNGVLTSPRGRPKKAR